MTTTQITQKTFDDLPLILRAAEVAALLKVSRNTVYELIHSNRLGHIKLNRRILIPKDAVIQFIDAATMTA